MNVCLQFEKFYKEGGQSHKTRAWTDEIAIKKRVFQVLVYIYVIIVKIGLGGQVHDLDNAPQPVLEVKHVVIDYDNRIYSKTRRRP